jgi:hypothetical protein
VREQAIVLRAVTRHAEPVRIERNERSASLASRRRFCRAKVSVFSIRSFINAVVGDVEYQLQPLRFKWKLKRVFCLQAE